MYHIIRLYGSKLVNIIRLRSFLRTDTIGSLFIQLIRDFFCFHFRECRFFEIRKMDSIRRWMDKHYGDFVPATFPPLEQTQEKGPVWVFWYQGEAAMPEVVKICYNSIIANTHDRPVRLLTKDNIASYITLPDYVYDRLNRGELSYTHFSDILRICLLFKGGGIWMDSTLLLTAPVRVDTSDYFHSIKIADGGHTTISEYRWATFFLASAPNNPAFGIIKTIFLAYIREHGKMIDYFLIDYIFDLVYRRNGSFRQSVDKTLCTSPYLHQLIFDMNKPYNAETFNRIQQKTTLFKLNYRVSFHETAGTLYGYLKKNSNSRNKR